MPVQLPRINVSDVAAPITGQRMNVDVPDMVQATAPLSRGIEAGTKAVTNALEARETEIKKRRASALDIKSTEEDNQFQLWSKQRIAEINLKEGDTTADYVEYDKQAQEKYKEVFSKYETMDSDFKELLDNKLNSTYQKQQTFRNIQQSEQNYKWRAEVANNKVRLEQDSFFQSGMYLDINNKETFNNLDTYARDIIQTRIAHADQTGTLVRKEDGTPEFETGPVSVLIRKDIGEAVIPLVKTLNATPGKVKEGKAVIEKYAPYLNASDRAKLMSDNDEADVNNQAIVKLAELQQQVATANPGNPDRRVMLSDIEKMKDLSPAVRFKLIEKNDIYNKRQDAEQGRQLDVLVSSEFEKLVKKQASTDPYVSEEEWANSPEGKNILEQMNKYGGKPSDINNLRAMVVAPTKSKKSALDAFNQGVVDRSLAKMTPREIAEIYPHLNKQDRARFDEIRRDQLYDSRSRKAEGPVTGDKISGMHGRMSKALEEQMKSFRDPKSGDLIFETNSKGKFQEEYDTQMLTDYNSLIREDILRAGGKLTGPEENKIVNKRLNEMIEKRKEDHKGVLSKFLGVDYKPTPKETRPTTTFRPPGGAYGARNTAPLAPAPVVDTTVTATTTPSVNLTTNKITTLPSDSDRKSWIKMYEESKGTKFNSEKDVAGFKKFKEEVKKKFKKDK